MSPPSLEALQRWMQTVITHPDGPGHGACAAQGIWDIAPDELGRVIDESGGVAAQQRLAIYASGYITRLMHGMQADFPALRHAVGDELFDQFASGYLWSRPSRSYTLFELGAGFPQFLEETRPATESVPEEARPMLDLPVELARLERAWVEVLRGPGIEHHDLSALEHLPIGPLGDLPLQPAPSLRLLSLRFPLADYVHAIRTGRDAVVPAPKFCHIALSRRNYAIEAHEIEPWQHGFLDALFEHSSLNHAAAKAAEHSGDSVDFVQARLPFWLPIAVARGYLSGKIASP